MSTAILCVELSVGLLDPACSLEQVEQQLVPYVLQHTQTPQGMGILGLGKKERQKQVKELTHDLLSGQGEAAMRFQNHLRQVYGTRMQWIESSFELMSEVLKDKDVIIVGFKGDDSGVYNVELLTRCQRVPVECKLFEEGTFNASNAMDFLFDLERPRPLWVQLVSLIRPSMKSPTIIAFGTSPSSTETLPDRMSVVASVLESLGNPCLSVLSFGSWSSERLSCLEELCAWSGGLSINLQDPEALPLAVQSLTRTLFGPERGGFLEERRAFYRQKENVGCTRWHLSRADKVNDVDQMDSSTPSTNMLAVLHDTEFTAKRRWARSLRWWRRRRGIRDCVFADPGSLGVELDQSEDGSWVVKATHPPASALNLKIGSRLEAINNTRVCPTTLRVEITQRVAIRPASLAFREDLTATVTPPAEDVLVEVVISEMRERFDTLKPGEPPLSLAMEAKVKPGDKVMRLYDREATRSSQDPRPQAGLMNTSSLFLILCAAGSLELLGRCAITCSAWRDVLRLTRDGEAKTTAQSLWKFLIRYGESVKRRAEFWRYIQVANGTPLGSSLDAQVLVLGAGHLSGLEVAHAKLERLDAVLGFCGRPCFEQARATVIWGLGSQALVDLSTLARAFQVLLAAWYMPLFRRLGADGMAPELFFVKWLMTMLTNILTPQVLIRIWEAFLVEKSFKCILQACVYIFGQCESELKKCVDMEQCMEFLYGLKLEETDPVEFWIKARRIKVTRSLLRRMRET